MKEARRDAVAVYISSRATSMASARMMVPVREKSRLLGRAAASGGADSGDRCGGYARGRGAEDRTQLLGAPAEGDDDTIFL